MSKTDPLIEAVTPVTNWVVVLRPFHGDNYQFVRGEVCDSTGWTHTKTLIGRRYVAPLPFGAEVPELEVQSDGVERRIIKAVSENFVDEMPEIPVAESPKPKAKAKKTATKSS